MSNSTLLSLQLEAQSAGCEMGQAGSLGEEVLMSSLKSAVALLEREPNTVAVDTGKRPGPVLVPNAGKRVDNYVTSRVELANSFCGGECEVATQVSSVDLYRHPICTVRGSAVGTEQPA